MIPEDSNREFMGATGATGPFGEQGVPGVNERGARGARGETGKWKMSLFISALALLVAVGSNLTSYRVQQNQTDKLSVVVCGLIDSDKNATERRDKTAKAAVKLQALADSLPSGPAKDAVQATADVFKLSGVGNADAKKAVNAQLEALGCQTRVG